MRIQTDYMSFKNRWTISCSYDFQAHLSFPKEDDVFPDCSTVIRRAPRLVVGAPRLVVGAPRCTQACRQHSQVHVKATASVQYTLGCDHPGIPVRQLSDTSRGSQTPRYIMLMHSHDYEFTRECSFSFWLGSLHDRPPPASSPWELKDKVTSSHSHG